MNKMWIEKKIEVDAVDWKGNSIHLKDVPAIQNTKTSQIRVYPYEVAKAEIRDLAEKYGLEPRDVPLLLMLYAKPGIFKRGEVEYQYKMNKMLFYQWTEMEKEGLGETFPHDEFEPKRRGPVPKNITEDLERLSNKELLTKEYHRWGKGSKDESLKISLTDSGVALAEQLAHQVPEPLYVTTLKAKEKIFPLSPKSVKTLVHKEFPEYQKTYTEEDRD